LLLLGPLHTLLARQFYVSVTDKAVYFHRISLTGVVRSTERYEYAELVRCDGKKGLLNWVLKFRFLNGRKTQVTAFKKSRVEGMAIQPGTPEELSRLIGAARGTGKTAA
jgi:hypothetical protein